MYLLHSAQTTVARGAYTQLLLTALAQRAARHAEHRADFSHAQERFGSKQILEPGEDISMPVGVPRFLDSMPG